MSERKRRKQDQPKKEVPSEEEEEIEEEQPDQIPSSEPGVNPEEPSDQDTGESKDKLPETDPTAHDHGHYTSTAGPGQHGAPVPSVTRKLITYSKREPTVQQPLPSGSGYQPPIAGAPTAAGAVGPGAGVEPGQHVAPVPSVTRKLKTYSKRKPTVQQPIPSGSGQQQTGSTPQQQAQVGPGHLTAEQIAHTSVYYPRTVDQLHVHLRGFRKSPSHPYIYVLNGPIAKASGEVVLIGNQTNPDFKYEWTVYPYSVKDIGNSYEALNREEPWYLIDKVRLVGQYLDRLNATMNLSIRQQRQQPIDWNNEKIVLAVRQYFDQIHRHAPRAVTIIGYILDKIQVHQGEEAETIKSYLQQVQSVYQHLNQIDIKPIENMQLHGDAFIRLVTQRMQEINYYWYPHTNANDNVIVNPNAITDAKARETAIAEAQEIAIDQKFQISDWMDHVWKATKE